MRNRIVAIILAIVLSVASATAGIRHYCNYSYDGMSRLTDAAYSESGRIAIPGLSIQGTPDYSTSYSYDLNGNPTQIYRKGIAHKYASGSNRQWQYDEIDNLYIDYRGNQVNFTDDSCPWGYYENAPGYIEESNDDNEYTWDANGNMTKDLNRGITSIQYNLQNQPTRIVYNDRHYEGRTYNSAGQKLRTIHTVLVTSATSSSTSTTTLVIENKRDYYGEDLVYRNDTLEMVLTDNGYVDASGRYHYYILDYQGNVRQVVDAQGNVIEQNDYYPYGGLFGESASRQNYKYSGKELETMNGLNTYDFHARPYYYPVLQFHSPDLLSEKTPWLSPYLYCAGNPIMLIDPTGMEWYSIEEIKQNQETGENYTEIVYLYTSLKSQEEMDAAGVKGRFLGEVVVVFNGSMNEKLGEGQSLYGKGAVLADVTVYGPNGANDIKQYKGYTMSSDFEKFGAIADGEYNVNYVVPGKGGSLSSNYAINNGNAVNCINGVNPSPKEYNPYSSTQKNGIYIHRSNNNGWAGDNSSKKSAVSTGCLLILPKQWNQFCSQIGKNDFKLILNRNK